MPQRIILHVDMDALFTAAEEREHPELKGKPVVVGANPKDGHGRGVVSTANYKAREYGIRSGMPISWAYSRCPDAVFLPVNMELYANISASIMVHLRKYADKFEHAQKPEISGMPKKRSFFEQVSIDEAFLDVSSSQTFEKAKEIAEQIKKEIKEKEHLTCSVGIGSNKLIAKIASDYRKPDGLTIVTPSEVKAFLEPLNVRKLPGVGPKAEAAFKEMGILTIGQLAKADLNVLTTVFGNAWGDYLHRASEGIDEREVEESTEIKSVSRRITFEKDTKDRNAINKTLKELADQVTADLKAYGFATFKTITLIIRYEDFETHTKQKTLIEESADKEVISTIARDLATDFLSDPRKIRLVGVSVSRLK